MISRLRIRQSNTDDRGITLVEMLAYMILLGIVLAIISGVIITAMRKQTEIVSTSQANDKAQLIASSIDMAVSNAAGVDAIDPTTPGGSQLLITATRSTFLEEDHLGVIRCVGFFYDAETHTLHSINAPKGANPATKAAREGGLDLAKTWPVLATNVEPVPGFNVFAGPGSSQFADEELRGRIGAKINLNVKTTRDVPPVTVNQFAVARGDRNEPSGCW